MVAAVPTGRQDDEEAESSEAREVTALAAGELEDWPQRVSSFVFVASLGLVGAYVRRGVGPAVSEKEADCRQGPAAPRFRLGQWRHGPALVDLT